jgi:hypothetical protein
MAQISTVGGGKRKSSLFMAQTVHLKYLVLHRRGQPSPARHNAPFKSHRHDRGEVRV